MRRDQPRVVPRPGVTTKPVAGLVTNDKGAMVATGFQGMLAASQARGAVTVG